MKPEPDNTFTSLKGHFLIAMPGLSDPFFSKSVICICEHTPEGALGLVVNHPHSLVKVKQIFEEFKMAIDSGGEKAPLHIGGPVQLEEIYVLHSQPFGWQGTLVVTPEIALTNTLDVLDAVSNGSGPEKYLMTLGCSGWGAGQLETELMENAWLTTPADETVIFDVSADNKWEEAVKSAGIDPLLLTSTAGRA